MKILMMTNTYSPIIGGLERSIDAFTTEYRRRGHRVMIVAPEFENMPERETDVVRVPAVRNFNGSEFSVQLPIPGILTDALNRFEPDIVHAHHPYLLGDTAMRVASTRDAPIVFTHHTMYEQYTHYIPGGAGRAWLKRFIIALSTGYANMADRVFAPSESVQGVLRSRGVTTPIDVVPTGIQVEKFANGDGAGVRRKHGIPEEAFVVGHLGRLAPEKNLNFLALSVAAFLKKDENAHFLVIGKGPSEQAIRTMFERAGAGRRLHLIGARRGQALVDACHAIDAFTFTSHSETQGLVLVEAMAAGLPVVAVDAPGVREVVRDYHNGRLFFVDSVRGFSDALAWMRRLDPARFAEMKRNARKTAERFAMDRCAERALALYEKTLRERSDRRVSRVGLWELSKRRLKAEWNLMKNFGRAARLAAPSSSGAPAGALS